MSAESSDKGVAGFDSPDYWLALAELGQPGMPANFRQSLEDGLSAFRTTTILFDQLNFTSRCGANFWGRERVGSLLPGHQNDPIVGVVPSEPGG